MSLLNKATLANNLRVHIVPVGFEHKRVTEPLIKKQADKVYFVTREVEDDASDYLKEIKKELQKNYKHIQFDVVYLDIWDFYACVKKFREIIQNECGNHVHINISTGTKITAIAGMLSCMLWDATPYYAHVSYENRKKIKFISEHIEGTDDLPIYEIIKPKKEYTLILSILQENKDTLRKYKIIKKLEELKIIRTVSEDGKDLSNTAKHSQLRALLDPMLKLEYIHVKASGRKSEVTITEQGKNALKIFGDQNSISK